MDDILRGQDKVFWWCLFSEGGHQNYVSLWVHSPGWRRYPWRLSPRGTDAGETWKAVFVRHLSIGFKLQDSISIAHRAFTELISKSSTEKTSSWSMSAFIWEQTLWTQVGKGGKHLVSWESTLLLSAEPPSEPQPGVQYSSLHSL